MIIPWSEFQAIVREKADAAIAKGAEEVIVDLQRQWLNAASCGKSTLLAWPDNDVSAVFVDPDPTRLPR